MTEPKIVKADHLSDIEAKRVALFACEVGTYLSLPRYRYSVMEEPCEKDALATIHSVEHRHVAQIRLSEEWMERGEQERMNTIIHEVCHLLHRDLDNAVKAGQVFMHSHEFVHVWALYQREAELMVDYLAQFIQDFSSVSTSWELMFSRAEAELAG